MCNLILNILHILGGSLYIYIKKLSLYSELFYECKFQNYPNNTIKYCAPIRKSIYSYGLFKNLYLIHPLYDLKKYIVLNS